MSNPARILLLQLYSNGDCLYATAVARQIKHDFPGCHLVWQIADFCKDIIRNNPYVDDTIIVNIQKNDIVAFRKLKKTVLKEKRNGLWDEVFITHNIDENQALYDGTVRGMIFRAYKKPITVPIQPTLVLTNEELLRVKQFAQKHSLETFSHVILWEYAPLSGQSLLNFDFVMKTAEQLSIMPGTCIVLSSANSFSSSEKIIDASSITFRENAALTHYCTMMIGCSSGITWLSTSSAAKQLPMIQLLDPYAYFRNAPSTDFSRYGINSDELVELTRFDEEKIVQVVGSMVSNGAVSTKEKYNEVLPVQFNTTRKIVYNLLCYLQFRGIIRHFRITTSIYGYHALFLKEFALALLAFPFKLVANKWRKRKL